MALGTTDWLTLEQAARLLRLQPDQVRILAADGNLEAVSHGGHLLLEPYAVERTMVDRLHLHEGDV